MCEFREVSESEASKNSQGVKQNTLATVENGNNGTAATVKSNNSVDFDIALLETKFGKFNYFLIITAGLVLANVLLETLGISFVLPVSSCDLQWTNPEKGVLSAIGFAGIISSSHLWGFLADTTGRRRVIRPTLFVGFIMTVVSSFGNSFWTFVITRYLNGVFISGGSATIYPYLSEFHSSKTRSRAIMGAAFIFGIGSMLLPSIAWLVINQSWSLYIPFLDITYKPWRLFMVVCGIPGLVCFLFLLKIPESPKFLLSQGKEQEAVEILQKMYTINTGRPKEECNITSVYDNFDSKKSVNISGSKENYTLGILRSMWIQTSPLFNKKYIRTTFLACTIQFGMFATSNGMYMWFPDILNRVVDFMHENTSTKAKICDIVYAKQVNFSSQSNTSFTCNEHLEISTYQHSLVLEICYAVGFALIGFIINSVSKLVILFTILIICGACGVAVVAVDIPIASIYLYLILLLCGLGVNVVNAATVDLYPTNLRAMAICISLMMGRLGSVVGANIVAVLLDNNCETAFLASGISLIVCGFLGFLLPKPPGGSTKIKSRRGSIISMTGN